MKRLDDGQVQMTMSWHLKEKKAWELRDRLDETVDRVASGGTYHVEETMFGWKVVKRWFTHANGNQILGSSKKG